MKSLELVILALSPGRPDSSETNNSKDRIPVAAAQECLWSPCSGMAGLRAPHIDGVHATMNLILVSYLVQKWFLNNSSFEKL